MKDSTATSCLPASAEAFAALYSLSAETKVPSVSGVFSVEGRVGGSVRWGRVEGTNLDVGIAFVRKQSGNCPRNGTRVTMYIPLCEHLYILKSISRLTCTTR